MRPSATSSEFEAVRSGLTVGLGLGGSAAAGAGLLAAACAFDLVTGLLLGRAFSWTSLLVGGVCAVVLVVFGHGAYDAYRRLALWTRIHERGIAVPGTLGEPRPTNHRLNRLRLHDLPLVVTPADRPAYEITTQWFVPGDVRDAARAGARVVVRVDPADPSAALVDWDATRAAWGLPTREAD